MKDEKERFKRVVADFTLHNQMLKEDESCGTSGCSATEHGFSWPAPCTRSFGLPRWTLRAPDAASELVPGNHPGASGSSPRLTPTRATALCGPYGPKINGLLDRLTPEKHAFRSTSPTAPLRGTWVRGAR